MSDERNPEVVDRREYIETADPRRPFWRRIVEAFEEWDGFTSMTRVVAFMFALVLCAGIIIMAAQDHLHESGWPFAVMVCAAIFAVPLQAMAKALVEFFKSHAGRKLLGKLVSKVTTGDINIDPGSSEVTTTTTVAPPGS